MQLRRLSGRRSESGERGGMRLSRRRWLALGVRTEGTVVAVAVAVAELGAARLVENAAGRVAGRVAGELGAVEAAGAAVGLEAGPLAGLGAGPLACLVVEPLAGLVVSGAMPEAGPLVLEVAGSLVNRRRWTEVSD